VKLIAAILLILFSSFTMEQMMMPSFCSSTEKSCKIKSMKSGCCKKIGNMSPMPTKKNKGKSPLQCTDCPLCVVLINEVAEYSNVIVALKNNFSMLQVNDIADHSYPQWKPPNA
jgi:hypothetical protein